jgi:glycosyltransferase involved in cell wall biosynthesis
MAVNKILNAGISIVVPAYNEENAIQSVVERTFSHLSDIEDLKFEIIVVDDCSRDDTLNQIPRNLCKALRHPKNYGYGRSLLTGINNAIYPYIGIIDADNTYDPELFKEFIPAMDIYDMVIGARKIEDQSPVVALMRIVLKRLLFFFSEHWSLDPNSGMRIFKKSLVEKGGHLFSKRFSFSTSLTFFAALNQQFIEYIPIEYHDRTGNSKVRHLRDSQRTFWLVMSMALIYKPIKCFFSLAAINLVAISILFSLRQKLADKSYYSLLLGWLSMIFIIASSFFAFISGKNYEQIINDKD